MKKKEESLFIRIDEGGRNSFEKADRVAFECSAKPPYAVEKFCAIFIVFFALFWWYNRGRI